MQHYKEVPQGFKHCYKCGRILPLTLFGRNKAKKDGYHSECKECRLKAKRIYYHKHPEKARLRKKRWREKYREKIRESRKKYYKANPQANKAHDLVNYLSKYQATKYKSKYYGKNIRKKSKCQICGSTTNLQCHHFDYNKPLNVYTFCASCHGFVHVMLKRIEENPFKKELINLLFGKSPPL